MTQQSVSISQSVSTQQSTPVDVDMRHDGRMREMRSKVPFMGSEPGGWAGYGLACASLALSMSLVGAYVALSKPLLAAFPVFLLAWLRFGIGALAMLHWLKKPLDEPQLDTRTHAWLFLQSLFGNFLFSIFMLYGMRMTGAVTAGIIMAAIPAAVALLGRLFLGETMGARTLWAITLAVAGLVLAHVASTPTTELMAAEANSPALLGALLLIAAVFCEALYVVIGKKLTHSLRATRISALINLWGFALTTPLGLLQAFAFDFFAVGIGHWALLLFYALAASVWTVWLWMTGLRRIPVGRSGVFTVFLPISAALMGWLALDEQIFAMQWLAFAVALLGVMLATSPAPAKHSDTVEPASR